MDIGVHGTDIGVNGTNIGVDQVQILRLTMVQILGDI